MNRPFQDVDALLAISGVPAQQIAYGAPPSRAAYPLWMQERHIHSMYPATQVQPDYGAMAYGAGLEMYGAGLEMYGAHGMTALDVLNPSYGYQPYAYGHHPHHHHYGAMAYGAAAPHPAPPVAARGVQVEQRLGQHVRRFPMGFTSVTAVNAGAAASVQAQPQVPFRPEKFVVPSDIAGSFDITNILVGKDSQFVVPNPIPARAFSETAVDNLLSFHGVAISQIVTIQVSNTGGANLIFKAYMTGTAVE